MSVNVINSFSQDFTVRKSSKETTGGVHPKRHVYRNGKLYLQKAGALNKFRFENLTPVLECMASEIGRELWFNVVKYDLEKTHLNKSANWFEQDVLISECEWFLKEGEDIIHVKDLNIGKDRLYEKLCEMGFSKSLNDMIVFDFLINSNDRHLKNFALIRDLNGGLRFSPIYDIGYSLTANCDDETVEYIYDEEIEEFSLDEMLEDIDVSLSFTHSNKGNLRLIKDYEYKKIDKDRVLSIVDTYELPELRKTFIKDLLNDRINYLNKWGEKFEGSS